MKGWMTREVRCKAEVYRRDCLRRTGRGRNGFEMHYNRDQCERKRSGAEFCWQHQREKDRGRNVGVSDLS
jgi:hypothetical protein